MGLRSHLHGHEDWQASVRIAKKDEDEFFARYLEGRKDENGYGPIETLHRVSRNVLCN